MTVLAGDDEIPSLRNAVYEFPDPASIVGKRRPPRPSTIVPEENAVHADTQIGLAAEEESKDRLPKLQLAAIPELQDELLLCAEMELQHVGIEELDDGRPLAEILGKAGTP